MKHISSLLILFLCYGPASLGQTQSLADPMVAGQKTIMNGDLEMEIALRIKQRILMEGLRELEDEYGDKRAFFGNLTSSAFYGSLWTMIERLDTKIASVEQNIIVRKAQKLGFRHGLKGHESQLAREKGYFERIRHEFDLMKLCVPLSGGSGYNYNAFLKLLIRLMEVRQNVLVIDMEVKKLMYASELLAK